MGIDTAVVQDTLSPAIPYPHARWALPYQLATGYPNAQHAGKTAIATLYPSHKMDHYMGVRAAINMRTAADLCMKASLQSLTSAKAASVSRLRMNEAFREWEKLQSDPNVVKQAPLNALTSFRAATDALQPLAADAEGQTLMRNVLEAYEATRLASDDMMDAAHLKLPGDEPYTPSVFFKKRNKDLLSAELSQPSSGPPDVYSLTSNGCTPNHCDFCTKENPHVCIVCKDGSAPDDHGGCTTPIPGTQDLEQEMRKRGFKAALQEASAQNVSKSVEPRKMVGVDSKPFHDKYYQYLEAPPFKEKPLPQNILEKMRSTFL